MKREIVVRWKFKDGMTIHEEIYTEEDEGVNDSQAVENALLEMGMYYDGNMATILSITVTPHDLIDQYRQSSTGGSND